MTIHALMFLHHRKRPLSAPQSDTIVIAVLIGLTYGLCIAFEVAERFADWAAPLEPYQVDELPLVLLVAAIAAFWFSRRRMRELSTEVAMRIRAEQAANESLNKFQTLFIEGLSGNFVTDAAGNVTLCNEAFRTMSGMSVHGWQEFSLAGALEGRWETLLADLRQSGRLDFSELTLARPDRGPWIVMARFNRSVSAQDNQEEIHGYFVDITEQHLAEKELASLLAENRALTGHAMRTQEEERSYLAREIHDDLGQYLTAIRLDAAAILQGVYGNTVATHTRRIIRHTEHIQMAIKRILGRLRPAALDAHGLVDAIQCLAREWCDQNTGVACTLELDETCGKLPEPISIVAYRIVQEALTNIARHAKAKSVNIAVHRIHTNSLLSLLVEVQDDGIGFKPSSHRLSFGLSGMRERVESVKGVFRLVSGPGTGVLISAKIPLSVIPQIEHVKDTTGG